MPWRESGLQLARLFVDYEAGIHWSQCQMQSGTTGINTIRIYNPIKQGQDHDPGGTFIRRWVPELVAVPAVHLHEPWTMAVATQHRVGCVLGVHYPLPIVETDAAAWDAKERIWAQRQELGFSVLAEAIQRKHGSCRSGLAANAGNRRRQAAQAKTSTDPQRQLELDLA